MSELTQLIDLVRKFRDERDWAQFHNAKDLAAGLSIEAGELLEQNSSGSSPRKPTRPRSEQNWPMS